VRVVLLLVAVALFQSSDGHYDRVSGWASAYAPGVMQATVEYRLEHGYWFSHPPYDWYAVAGYIAVNDCTRVGEIATLIDPSGKQWRVLVADCGGNEGPGQGADWMTRNNIVAELNAELWNKLVAQHKKPLYIEIVYADLL
jgi:hypothetical protein